MHLLEDVTLILAVVVSCLIVFLSFMHFWRKRNLPPGPTPLPILGNLLQLSKGGIVTSLLKLKEKYGEVFTVYLGSRPVIVVTGYKAVKEVYVDRGDDFLARGDVFCFDLDYKNYGITFTSDMDRWRDLRKFSLSTMRDFGMGKTKVEDLIREEALCLVTEFKKAKESLVEPRHYLSKAACNVIFAIIFGNRHDYEDAELLNVMSLMYATLSIASSEWGQLYEMFPWAMRYMPGRHQKIFTSMKKLIQFVERRVEVNKKILDENNPRSYVDAFLIKTEKEKNNPKTEFQITNLVYSTLQIFFAGVESISTALAYSLLLLMKYPNVLEKVHKEIDQVIGGDRCPKFQDRSQMPFTDAVIHEILRFTDLLPFGLPRKTTRDITYRGYSIPKDTNVYAMLSSALKDPTHFPYPNEFNPQNFLDESGEFKKNDAFIPFATGKKLCLGESLTRVETFIILITLLQNFEMKSPVPPEDLDITPWISGLKRFWRKGNLPPGPTPLPILGNCLQLSKGDIVKSLLKLKEKYGEVFTVYLGSRPVIVVTGYKAVKEVLVDRGDDFLARGDMPSLDFLYKNYGVSSTSDMRRWRELRRFSLSTMRNFGMGRKTIEDRVEEEVLCLVTELKKTKESLVDPQQYFGKAACNVLFAIMFGNRHEYDNTELLNVVSLMHKTLFLLSSGWGQLYDMFPRVMGFIPGRHQKLFIYMEELFHFVKKRVEMNKKTLDKNNPRDYVDAFLIKMEKENINPKTEFHMTNLLCSTMQIFFAGVETTSTTLTYSILLFMKYPDVTAKVQKEIEKVIGRNRSPKSQDRSQMPFTDAVIHEAQRFMDLLPMGVPRKTPEDITYRGYSIPKHTNVFPMLSSVLKDPSCFPYPNEFNPKNFLTENGEFKKNDAFIPLSAGKRICLGESLVRMELFIFLTTILQNFNLKPSVTPEDLDITPDVSGLGNMPKQFKMAFIPR
ncbi:cytochrome P450 2B1-like [Anomaloglossus baeobatrachus]|uniref:cytochrome P450 2B1-like n=1 Tax=Anomaloglossus baeobatrachus TaxID=238106 RepID=UPI003F5009C2